ncbi:helix-turn-helix transcriptional regulator [Superficieibacter electus]|uniref:Helix-turn-helix transcriptional regulator n=1 Tax=Superficieibacter electus TaxID=2022662 RepID=A0A2P5GPP8_9ENTR|nr:response regulator transcription factor [Superficieibacter electus]POP45220.1 helix-turn-helix transcriptional regulator [Superficieibacter electus]POP48504.1 helix-turn-helix transcriptional regulator [Superficieibacter electus]
MQVIMFDRQSIFIHGMKISLQQLIPEIDIQGLSQSEDLWECLETSPEAILMLDGDMGSEVCQSILQEKNNRFPQCRVLLVVSDCTKEWLQDVLRYNVLAVVQRDSEPDKFSLAINSVAMGLMCLPGDWLTTHDENEQEQELQHLSSRQREILKLLAAGDSNKQISRTLNISAGTVKAHLESIYRRLDVKNRTQAAMMFNETSCN